MSLGRHARRPGRRNDLLRTLHIYLGKDLAKTLVLALVAFTLVTTVFAIIEPLRKQGLAGEQVILFIGYTLPGMVSLTLPIAALFAATIVYGRLSQDNELLACRASGIATIALLRPVLLLGVIVTASSLYLSNAVVPDLVAKLDVTVKANLRGIMYQQLKKQMYVRMESKIIHADAVSPEKDTLYGVVIAETQNPANVSLLAVQSAQILFQTYNGDSYAAMDLQEPVIAQSANYNMIRETQHAMDSYQIKQHVREDPGWYRWNRLLSTFNNPVENTDIRRLMDYIRRDIGQEWLGKDIAEAIEANQPYMGLTGKKLTCALTAGAAVVRAGAVELQSDPSTARNPRRVSVKVVSDAGTKTVMADRAEVTAGRSLLRSTTAVSIHLTGNVKVRVEGRKGEVMPGMDEWVEHDDARIGDLSLPTSMEQNLAKIDLRQLYEAPSELTVSPEIAKRVNAVRDIDVLHLQSKILAEMHWRVARAASCFLLVAMGAAMGMLYRGGQIISAFALSVVPAFIVNIMMLMGQQMVGNADVPRIYGLAAIWGGIVLLVIGNGWLYLRLVRR